MPRVVVLGTGTGVGKTFFTVELARALAERRPSAHVLALKPIETGLSPRRRGSSSSDADRLDRVSTVPVRRPHPLYSFRDPISPHLAARRSNRMISLQRLASWIRRAEQNDETLHATTLQWVLIETAGGAFSPLTSTVSNADLAGALEPAIWILVAPDALGVLHDMRATLTALRHHAREPDFVVLSAARARDASTGTNARELARLGIADPIATLSRNAHARRALSRLVSAIEKRALKLR
jgi:dethiobiotin synthetase